MSYFSPNRVTLITLDFFPRNMLKGVPKKTMHEVLNFFTIFMGSISPKVIQKTENETSGRYRLK